MQRVQVAALSGTFRIGTRGSALARVQASRAQTLLEQQHPHQRFEQVIISTHGDRDKQTPLTIIGGQGVFVKELQRALIDGEIDCAVHSLKDLPSELPQELDLAAIVERNDPRDVLVSSSGKTLMELPAGARVGTSSRRRAAELLHVRPDIEIVDLRGNVDTRMTKVLDGSPERYDAAILAAAGVLRMGWGERIVEYLDPAVFVPSPGQAALGIECRAGDVSAHRVLDTVHDPTLGLLTGAERAFLRAVGGGCRSPIGAHATLEPDGQVMLRAMLASEDLSRVHLETITAATADINAAACELAGRMLAAVQAG